ncbi:SH3 domain-containing protein [Chloroflexi bacterium TSY]|nr:SH3 domain-containing protein [Chloroflexi bacterium TSY]
MPQRKDILFESIDDQQQADRQRPKTITVTVKVRDLLISLLILIALMIGVLGYIQQNARFTKIAHAQSETTLPDLNDSNNGILAFVGADGAELYETPAGDTLGSLTIGSTLTAVGRSNDNLWVVVITNNGATGWVEADRLVLFGLEELPVMFGDAPTLQTSDDSETDPTATATIPVASTATPTPTETPTPIPTPTPTPRPTPTPTEVTIQPVTVLAVVRGGGAEVVDRPGGTSLVSMQPGSTLDTAGLTQDGAWLQVSTIDGVSGWVSAQDVLAFQLDKLPFVEPAMVASSPGNSDDIGSRESNDSSSGDIDNSSDESANEQTNTSGDDSSSEASSNNNADAETATSTPVISEARLPASPRLAPENPDGLPVGYVAMNGSRLNIRSGPGTNFVIIGKALPNEEFVVLGRNEDGSWLRIQVPDIAEGFGWVSVNYFELNSGTISDLSVSDETSSAPVSTPIPTPDRSNSGANSGGTSNSTLSNQAAGASVAASSAVRSSPVEDLSGTLVFQESLGGNIYAYNLGTGALQWLTTGMDPAISPNSQQVAFTRFGGDGGLYIINIDGSGERRIYASDSGPRTPTWSPDGQTVAFTYVSGEYICKDTGIGICLKRNRFISNLPDKVKEERNLSVIDLNGENFRDLPALNTARAPDWHQGGIVYQATTSLEITDDKHDAENRKIVNEVVGYADPDWQPNGGRVVYQVKQGSHWEIFAINTDGTGEIPLTKPFTALVDELPSNVSPAWSPNGRHIAFVSNRAPDHEAGPWRLWVMDGDGNNQRQLPIDLELTYHFRPIQKIKYTREGVKLALQKEQK